MSYPDDVLQSYVTDQWWKKDEENVLRTGTLLWAIVNHVGVLPYRVASVGREIPADHRSAHFSVEQFTVDSRPEDQKLPISALPTRAGESFAFFRAKVRPVLVIAADLPTVENALQGKAAGYQTDPVFLVAPYYGATPGKRVGFQPSFLDRIKRCEFPQYFWDQLPLKKKEKEGAVLRLDHIMPIGRNSKWFNFTGYSLDDGAVLILRQWFDWVLTGELKPESTLFDIREALMKY